MSEERMLSVSDAAEFLGLSEYTVREYAKSGKLRGYKIGNGTSKRGSRRRWKFHRQDLDDFISRGGNAGV